MTTSTRQARPPSSARPSIRRGSNGGYWSQTREPLTCLAFLSPLLVLYEAGVLWIGGGAWSVRNGADAWMRGWLHAWAGGHGELLPLLVVGSLLGWHLCGRHRWRVSGETLGGMAAESLLFAFVLVIAGQLQDLLFREVAAATAIPLSVGASPKTVRAISFVGAGIYEEVLFRLFLLPCCYGLCRLTRLSVAWSAVLSAVATSLVFSLAHYVGPGGESPTIFGFTFRALAGLFFAGLFCLRGFGISVGAHAAYDLFVGLLLIDG